MKSYYKKITLIILLPAAVLLGICVFAAYKKTVSIAPIVLRSQSCTLVQKLGIPYEEGADELPRDAHGRPSFQTSVDYFNWLADQTQVGELQSILSYQRREQSRFSEKNMPWVIVKNLPEEVPNHFIVLATANVDARSLRTRLAPESMDKLINVTFSSPIRALRTHAFLVCKDGKVITLNKERSSPKQYTCREVYDNIPFDLTAHGAGDGRVTYLTPGGEVIPVND